MSITRAGTILMPSGPSHDSGRLHLFIVCTDVDIGGRTLLVPVTTWTNDLCDGTCRLNSHDHTFITHASYVFYRKSRIEFANSLLAGVQKGVLKRHDPCNGQTFLRVRNGICLSPHTPRKIKNYYGCP